MARLEESVGGGRKVKEEEEEVGEGEEGKMKEGVEAQVVVEKGGVTGMAWLRGFLGNRAAGAIMDVPWDPAVLASPHPMGLNHPLLLPPESSIWTLRFVTQRVHHKRLGQGRWVWVDERGFYRDKPPRVGGGGVPGLWHSQPEMPGGKKGKVVPPSDKGVTMFEMAQFNVFTPEVKKGGGGSISSFFAIVGRPWDWGYAGSRDNVGVVADVVGDHGGWGL